MDKCHPLQIGPLLRLQNLSKSFNGALALAETDLEFASGETTALIGPSGCGKSTLLRLIVGLISPDSGQIHFAGMEIGAGSLLHVRRRIGYVIQEGGLFPHLTGTANVTLLARCVGWTSQQISTRLDKLVALTHLSPELLERYPAELSGGQQQRISLMRALMLDPQLLLLDEPLGALDPMIRFELQADLKEIFARLKKTVLLVTHDLGEAAYFSDRIVLMNQGRLVQIGSVEDLLKHPAEPFVLEFIRAQRPLVDTTRGETV